LGCNCGQNKNKKVTYVYSYRGQTKEYRTEVEARAAQIRNGGGTITTKAA